MSVIRRIEASDVPQLFWVRAATDENRLTLDQLAALGINENSVREKLRASGLQRRSRPTRGSLPAASARESGTSRTQPRNGPRLALHTRSGRIETDR